MKPLLLDTHILLWYINQQKELPEQIKTQIEHRPTVCFSAMSCYEVAWLCQRGRILLPEGWNYQQWLDVIKTETDIRLLDVTPEIAGLAVSLPEHHKDPHDRIIIATALHYDYQLASVDGKFTLYDELSELLIH